MKTPSELDLLMQYSQRLMANVRTIQQAIENDDAELFGAAVYDLNDSTKPTNDSDGTPSLGQCAMLTMFNADIVSIMAAKDGWDRIMPRWRESMRLNGFEIDDREGGND